MARPLEEQQLTFSEHIDELRGRLWRCVFGFVVAVIVSWFFWRPLFALVVRPLVTSMEHAQVTVRLVAINPTEPVWVPMKLCMLVGLFVASPFIFLQLWGFFRPALYPEERKYVIPFVMLSALGFMAGGAFGYLFLLPLMYPVLLGMASGNLAEISSLMGMQVNWKLGPEVTIQPMLTLDNVFGFTIKTLLGCGLVFELPMVISLLAMAGIVTHRKLWKWNRYALVLSFLVGGILTPGPDVVSQVALGLPVLGLYNFSILLAWVITVRRENRLAQRARQDADDLDDEEDDDEDEEEVEAGRA